jgi:hypothetical protein
MEEAASAQRREIENNPRQNDTNLISTDIHLDKVHITWGASHFPYLSSTYLSYNQNVNFGAIYRNVPKQTTRVEQKKSKEILIE